MMVIFVLTVECFNAFTITSQNVAVSIILARNGSLKYTLHMCHCGHTVGKDRKSSDCAVHGIYCTNWHTASVLLTYCVVISPSISE